MASKRLQARRLNEIARQEVNAVASRYSAARNVAARECGMLYIAGAPAESVTQRDSDWTLVTPTFFTKLDPPECVRLHRQAQKTRAAQNAAAWGD